MGPRSTHFPRRSGHSDLRTSFSKIAMHARSPRKSRHRLARRSSSARNFVRAGYRSSRIDNERPTKTDPAWRKKKTNSRSIGKFIRRDSEAARRESDHFGIALFTNIEGQTIGDELSPWAMFQTQFNEIKAQIEEICSSPATLSKDNGELLEKTNALIDQFNAAEREYQITKLRAYIHQPHIRETWDSLTNSSLADYAQKEPKSQTSYEMSVN